MPSIFLPLIIVLLCGFASADFHIFNENLASDTTVAYNNTNLLRCISHLSPGGKEHLNLWIDALKDGSYSRIQIALANLSVNTSNEKPISDGSIYNFYADRHENAGYIKVLRDRSSTYKVMALLEVYDAPSLNLTNRTVIFESNHSLILDEINYFGYQAFNLGGWYGITFIRTEGRSQTPMLNFFSKEDMGPVFGEFRQITNTSQDTEISVVKMTKMSNGSIYIVWQEKFFTSNGDQLIRSSKISAKRAYMKSGGMEFSEPIVIWSSNANTYYELFDVISTDEQVVVIASLQLNAAPMNIQGFVARFEQNKSDVMLTTRKEMVKTLRIQFADRYFGGIIIGFLSYSEVDASSTLYYKLFDEQGNVKVLKTVEETKIATDPVRISGAWANDNAYYISFGDKTSCNQYVAKLVDKISKSACYEEDFGARDHPVLYLCILLIFIVLLA